MSSIREQITVAVAGKVNVSGVAAVYRSRLAPIDRDEGIVVRVLPKDEVVENRSNGIAIRDFTLEILLQVRSDTPDTTADPLVIAMHAALMSDQTLGGLCNRIIEEGTEWTLDDADAVACEVSLKYRIRYLTPWDKLDAIA